MPIYEYQCQSCEHKLEALQKIADALLTDCPACEKPDLKKQVTAAAFKLTGTGWYETDFKNSGKKEVKGAKEGKSSEGDSKPAEKSAPSPVKNEKSGGASDSSTSASA